MPGVFQGRLQQPLTAEMYFQVSFFSLSLRALLRPPPPQCPCAACPCPLGVLGSPPPGGSCLCVLPSLLSVPPVHTGQAPAGILSSKEVINVGLSPLLLGVSLVAAKSISVDTPQCTEEEPSLRPVPVLEEPPRPSPGWAPHPAFSLLFASTALSPKASLLLGIVRAQQHRPGRTPVFPEAP